MTTPTRSDWSTEKQDLYCTPAMWQVSITPAPALVEHMSRRIDGGGMIPGEITEEDQRRLIPKLRMVETIAANLAAGMLKGTLKYPAANDGDFSVGEWMTELKSDASDALNYVFLLEGRMKAVAMGWILAARADNIDVESQRGLIDELGVDFDELVTLTASITGPADLPLAANPGESDQPPV